MKNLVPNLHSKRYTNLHTVCFPHILMTELSMDRTKSWASWKSTSRMGNPYMWSLTRKGLLDLISYSSTCPVAVPTPSVRLPWNLSAVTDGKPSSLKTTVYLINVTIWGQYIIFLPFTITCKHKSLSWLYITAGQNVMYGKFKCLSDGTFILKLEKQNILKILVSIKIDTCHPTSFP
jgi:hypothetical protein